MTDTQPTQLAFPTWEAARDYCIELHDRGDLVKAEEGYRQLHALRPADPDILRLHGLALAQLARPEEGLPLLQEATRLAPKNPLCHQHLGFVLQKMGQANKALVYFRESARLYPQNPAPWVNIAAILLEQKDYAPALTAAKKAAALAPEMPEALHNLGFALLENEKPAEALEALQAALALRPDFPKCLFHLGRSHSTLGNLGAAEIAYRRCLELDPTDLDAANNLAGLWWRVGEVEEAMQLYRQILRCDPQSWEARCNLAEILVEEGSPEEGIRLLETNPPPGVSARKAIMQKIRLLAEANREEDARTLLSCHPAGDLDHALLSYRLGKEVEQEEALQYLRHALEQQEGSTEEQISLCFLLGNSAHESGDHAQAFSHYARGHTLLRKRERYDHALWQAQVLEELAWYRNTGSTAAMPPSPTAFPQPIFIVGMPRSGTSLLEQILDSHRQVAGAGELPDIARLSERLKLGQTSPLQAATDYLERRRTAFPQARRVTDKMPHNFQHLGVIAACFPNAPILVCRRDPDDNALSIWRQRFSVAPPYSHSLTDLAAHYAAHEHILASWSACIPNPIRTIVYEELVQDLSGTVRTLLEFLDLPWEEDCLHFHKNPRKVRTASRDQVRQALYQSSVGACRPYASFFEEFRQALHKERNQENLFL